MDLDVKDTYEEIAQHFSNTRYKVWTCVDKFISSLPKKSYGLEIGCGNGKNMDYCRRKNLNIQGIDFCNEFIKICKQNEHLAQVCDMRHITKIHKQNTFDFTLSIAVLHHLYKLSDRLLALKEQIKVTKVNGLIYIMVWAFEQKKEYQPRIFKKQDELVPWKVKDKTYYRYYHLYVKGELEKELLNFKNIEIINSFEEKGNYGIVCKKLPCK